MVAMGWGTGHFLNAENTWQMQVSLLTICNSRKNIVTKENQLIETA